MNGAVHSPVQEDVLQVVQVLAQIVAQAAWEDVKAHASKHARTIVPMAASKPVLVDANTRAGVRARTAVIYFKS